MEILRAVSSNPSLLIGVSSLLVIPVGIVMYINEGVRNGARCNITKHNIKFKKYDAKNNEAVKKGNLF